MKYLQWGGFIASFIFVMVITVMNVTGKSPISWGMHNDYNANHHHALDSYDVVSFYTEGKPIKGSKDFVYEWEREKWHFASEENMNLFKSDPEKYLPFCGGYCIVAAANDWVGPIQDFENFKIVQGKLIFFGNKMEMEMASDNIDETISTASLNWY